MVVTHGVWYDSAMIPRPISILSVRLSSLAILLVSLLLPRNTFAQAGLPIYTDHLVNGFQDWSWATHNLANSTPVHSGTASISAATANYSGLWLYHGDFDTSLYTNLTFWLNGGATGGQVLKLTGVLGGNGASSVQLAALPGGNTWRQITVSLANLGVAAKTNCNGFQLQTTTAGSDPTFYLDDAQLVAQPAPIVTHISINANQVLRSVDARWFGINTAIWDTSLDTSLTASLLNEMGTLALRFPGGSASDEYHWATGRSLTNTWSWGTSFANFAHLATNIHAQAIITVNYGTGTPAEAAAWVAHSNITNRYGFKYWEIGNELYGTWETDSNAVPNDPYTYAVRTQAYIQQMKVIDPTIKVGVVAAPGENSYVNNSNHPVTNSRTHQTVNGWTPVMLATLKSLGVTPDFLVHHRYPEYTYTESDPFLLQSSVAWAGDAATLRQELTDYLGPTGTNVELLCTENNSNSGDQGKQSVSLVNALYYADSAAQLMKTELNSMIWWDLRNGTDNKGNLDPVLYGWRMYGDLGLVGGTSTRYPPFYAAKILQYFARPGDKIVTASSDFSLLAAYATRRTNGTVALLGINKDPVTSFTAQINVTGYLASSNALLRVYGEVQDTAAQTGIGSPDIAVSAFGAAGTNFNYTFPPYSLTVLTLAPAAPGLKFVSGGGKNPVVLQLQGQPTVPYVIQTSTNTTQWSPLTTNVLSGTSTNLTLAPGIATSRQFYRAVWMP